MICQILHYVTASAPPHAGPYSGNAHGNIGPYSDNAHGDVGPYSGNAHGDGGYLTLTQKGKKFLHEAEYIIKAFVNNSLCQLWPTGHEYKKP